MNKDNEQIKFDTSVVIDRSQSYTSVELFSTLRKWLGIENVSRQTILGRKVTVYQNGDKQTVLLAKNITYLGNPHPIFKKRIQLPSWYQDFCTEAEKRHLGIDIRFIGVYHYEENVVFVDFLKDSYLAHGLHNSSAHVYTNDLYQAMTYGTFEKVDAEGNTIVTIRNNKFKAYMDGSLRAEPTLFDLFRQFNCGFTFGQWLKAFDVIREMHDNDWKQWRQAEWAGWFLEYKFDRFTHENHVENRMRYVGSSMKKEGELDFDIHFAEDDFYGDLKASDIDHKDTPGNDQESLIECIYRYKKFWYVIYEHETIKDSAKTGYEATIARNRYIKSVDPSYDKDEMSYSQRMKNSVKFMKMTIIELNAVNYRDALKEFNQGHQPDGKPRAPKFNIDKRTLENDNYVVFRYNYQ